MIMVVGLGNPLMGDDGVGARVMALLDRRLPARAVRQANADDCLELLTLWCGEEHVWLVDASCSRPSSARLEGDAGAVAPGTIHRLDHESLLALPSHGASAHHLSLADSLRWLAVAHPPLARVHYRLWAIEAASVVPGSALGSAVEAAAACVADEIARLAADLLRD